MKIALEELNKIIHEELQNVLNERHPSERGDPSEDRPGHEDYESHKGSPRRTEKKPYGSLGGELAYVPIFEDVGMKEEKKPLQKLVKDIEKKGTEGEFSEWCGGKVTQACIDRAAKEGGKRAKQASLAATFSKAKGGGPTLTYPKKDKE